MDIIDELNWLKVETGSLTCLGCGHEHQCSVHGCAILREAQEEIYNMRGTLQLIARMCTVLTEQEEN